MYFLYWFLRGTVHKWCFHFLTFIKIYRESKKWDRHVLIRFYLQTGEIWYKRTPSPQLMNYPSPLSPIIFSKIWNIQNLTPIHKFIKKNKLWKNSTIYGNSLVELFINFFFLLLRVYWKWFLLKNQKTEKKIIYDCLLKHNKMNLLFY